MLRMKDKYFNEVKPVLFAEFKGNIMNTAALEKITISVGAGELGRDAKILQNIQDTISLIAGQKAVVTKAKKSIAGFKLREEMPVGVKVTLRGNQMYNFFDKLVSMTLPRVKDFRGLSRSGFDGRGNYSFGLEEQLVFPEVVYDNILRTHGMNINISTTSENDQEAIKLLELMGLPFAKGKNNG
jgi:large subunit ribosomal protein L5